MKKLNVLLITILLLLLLSACGEGEEGETVKPLDPAEWPTPVLTQEQPTPTPFPKVDVSFIDSKTNSSSTSSTSNNTNSDQSVTEEATETTSGEETSSGEDTSSNEEATADNATTNETATDETATDETATDETAIDETATDETVTDETATDETTTDETATDETATDETATDETATDETATDEVTTEETAAPTLSGKVTSYGLNIRSGPGAGYAIMLELKQNAPVTILTRDLANTWVQVQSIEGITGWVDSRFLDIEGDLNDLESFDSPSTSSSSTTASTASTTGNTSTTSGNTSTTGGRLLIQPYSGGPIMMINRDGSGLQTLTSGIDPVLSYDGNMIAFTRWDGAEIGSVWVINTDGSGERMISGDIKQVKSPSWSPDNSRVAVNFQEGGKLEAVKECWPLTAGDPPINFWVAYDIEVDYAKFRICWKIPPDPHWKLRIINVSTGIVEDMPAGRYAFAPTWDPANDWRIVSTAGMGLVWTDINRGVAEGLTDDPADRAPVFSPNGKYLGISYRQHDHWDIHRLNADGTGRVRLTKTPLYAIVDGPIQWNNAAPVFSPDSSEIAFLTDRTGRWEVWVMNVDGSNQRPMFSEAINQQLDINYTGNDERLLGWGQ